MILSGRQFFLKDRRLLLGLTIVKGTFRTLSNIFDKANSQKMLMAESRQLFSEINIIRDARLGSK